MSKQKGQQAKPKTPQWVEDYHKETASKVEEFAKAVTDCDGKPFVYPAMVDDAPSVVQWWGVKDDKGQWAFGGGQVCHYPCETIARAHADSLSPRWKATPFAS